MHADEKGVNIAYCPNVLLRFCILLQNTEIIIRNFFSFVLTISYYTLVKESC